MGPRNVRGVCRNWMGMRRAGRGGGGRGGGGGTKEGRGTRGTVSSKRGPGSPRCGKHLKRVAF
eukprot:6440771-Pyramimonas_sp.AAC.1